MRTNIFEQGFNRVEDRQIMRLEQAKLKRFLDQERRVIEALIDYLKKEITTKPNIRSNAKTIWKRILNHQAVQEIRRRVDCLTDAYPQFLRQVEIAHVRIEEKFLEIFNIPQQAIRASIYRLSRPL